MAATCPSCSLADRTVPVPAALRDHDAPLDRPTRRLLEAPSESTRGSSGVTILLVFAAFSTLSTLRALVTLIWPVAGRAAGDLPVVLLSAAFTAALCWVAWWVRRSADRRRTAGGRPLSDEQWQLAHAIWQRAWLCRGCRAVFFPAGTFRPEAPASRALSFEHFHAWLAETAWHAGAADAAAGRSPAANTG